MLSAILGVVLFNQLVHSQFSPTPLWKSDVLQPPPNRIDTAYAALSEGVSRLSPYGGFLNGRATSPFYATLAKFEIAAQPNGTFQQLALKFFEDEDKITLCDTPWESIGTIPSNIHLQEVAIRDIINYGYAASQSYIAYGNSLFQQTAKKCWEIANQYTVSNRTWALLSRTIEAKKFTIPSECQGTPVEGLTFHNFSQDAGDMNLYETALFSLLSALLADSETPPNNTYILAAKQSLDVLIKLNKDEQLFQDPMGTISSSSRCDLEDASRVPVTIEYRAQGTSIIGFMIEALSILSPMINTADMEAFLQQIILSALNTTASGWMGPNGVMPNKYIPDEGMGAEEGDMYFVRGLAEAYRRLKSAPASLQNLIKVFLGVQYNAIRDHATSGDNVYGRSWQGPPPSSFDPYDQVVAAQILVDGIDLFSNDTQPMETPVPTPPTDSPHSLHASHPVGIIIGSTIGGVAAVTLLDTTSQVSVTPFPLDPRFEVTPFTWDQPASSNDESTPHPTKWHNKQHSVGNAQRVSPPRDMGNDPGLQSPVVTSVAHPPTLGLNNIAAREEGNSPHQIDMGATIPDLIRIIYQRLWQHDSQESPPDYYSQPDQN
ncbi:glycoside hydrolase family 76 protein [Moniliophthora roreri MCA 2997]|uniref:Glycoside hydrolase family 76 protein n=1 Tax=Moniliophthora roreri (strain MCA 2997) TaxID=1381753 RepID=V2Y666_MONRO|nr:glycoside hydrolase family 76 protein [Moniliophthora roreri MCA 2997]